ncbi:hypothetical protein EMOOHJMP_00172 [Microcystis phage MaAM05]|nr:hypothetical protein EMOOHJMP_00172 [Microcystis phage MaAM05]
MRIPVNFSGKQTTSESKKLGVRKSPLKASSSSKKAKHDLTQQLDQLSLNEVRTTYLGPKGQLPPVTAPQKKFLSNPTQDEQKKLLQGENRNLKKLTSASANEKDRASRLMQLRAKANQSDISAQQPIAKALNEALQSITEERESAQPSKSPLLTPTLESLKCTIALRDLLQTFGTLSFTHHAFARTLLRGEAITCLKASKEFLNNSKDSKTYLVFDRGINELATVQNKQTTEYHQLNLLRDNSATKQKVLIPLAPDEDQLVAKTVVAKHTINPRRYVVVADHLGKPITTLKQYQDELEHIKELSSCSKKLFQ